MPTPEPILAGLSGAGLAEQPTAPNSPQVLFSPTRRKVFVNGFEFDQDDADSALQSREHIKAPPQAPKDGGDWQPVSPDAYARYYNAIKDPTLGARFKGSFRGAVGGLQEIAGGALQFAGSTGEGSAGVRLSEAGQERARKNAPYVAQATDIGDPNVGVADFVASTLGMLAPSVLESIAAGVVGAGVGTAVGGPAGTVGGLAAGFAGKSVIKKSLLEAAKAQAKKKATKAQQKELADFASDKTGKDLLDAIRSQALVQAGAGGALIGTQVNETAIGIGDVYSEGLEQGTE
ncbi:MAG: hypothetical protein K0U66_05565, partial [Gammaproteobacteria bacterium]|nr:hypothetical protein [Gammaproteobacteria bacterium]